MDSFTAHFDLCLIPQITPSKNIEKKLDIFQKNRNGNKALSLRNRYGR
ncbi:MAG: hypothetical protein ACE5RN_03780 [Nitrosopumilaceae archaeon]